MSILEPSTHTNIPDHTNTKNQESTNDVEIKCTIALDTFEDTLPLAAEDPEPRETEDGEAYDPLHQKLRAENFALAQTGSNILIVGATGLVGSRLVKFIKRVKADNQVIFVLARRAFVQECPGVIVNIVDSALWGEEIAKIPNLTTVYCALGARPPNGGYLSEASIPVNEYYSVNHNIVHQVGFAAKRAGAKRFIYTSNHSVQSPIARIFDRRTKMRREIENDLISLDFDNVTILRPGPLVGMRLKAGSLTGINWQSLPEGLMILSALPVYFIHPYTPLAIVNFGTSVGKTGAMLLKAESTNKVNYIYLCQVILGAAAYNAFKSERLMVSLYKFLEQFTTDEEEPVNEEQPANEEEVNEELGNNVNGSDETQQ
ncbi:hypothetical protein BN7_1216 [Wickerhamomyces ciferrii]|uniref:NAD-dependent epimerase/dehydratase domain-containing protein n=1 Tax=Wickerhamomyces ciferrii (strain ATCC 14091 / BCRC 22168 / CBS 111 / JCM 3599 / NBRC 0793 / NRRL Y-1031 F-60-10) TaxID=1206466 RepID=K0K9S4_WICCF|nr:uncharacterized protein BN7_1216 [Wickerhamomyces ciferrii]CCH41675.1 hypothetical protein BN7_1216 [Wickerhamomyces ciferrii]